MTFFVKLKVFRKNNVCHLTATEIFLPSLFDFLFYIHIKVKTTLAEASAAAQTKNIHEGEKNADG